MVAIEENKSIDVILPASTQPLLKPIELKDIGFLQKQPTYIYCPACFSESLSVVRLEAVTCWQKFLKITNLRKTSENRCDINHYCSNCGCYIGRYVPIDRFERMLSEKARKKAARDDIKIKSKPTDCAAEVQDFREEMLKAWSKAKAEKAEQEKKENDKKEEDK